MVEATSEQCNEPPDNLAGDWTSSHDIHLPFLVHGMFLRYLWPVRFPGNHSSDSDSALIGLDCPSIPLSIYPSTLPYPNCPIHPTLPYPTLFILSYPILSYPLSRSLCLTLRWECIYLVLVLMFADHAPHPNHTRTSKKTSIPGGSFPWTSLFWAGQITIDLLKCCAELLR